MSNACVYRDESFEDHDDHYVLHASVDRYDI